MRPVSSVDQRQENKPALSLFQPLQGPLSEAKGPGHQITHEHFTAASSDETTNGHALLHPLRLNDSFDLLLLT